MAAALEQPSRVPPSQVVAIAFLEQYYHILTKSPKLVHRFYKDSSRVNWPGQDGVMSHVTTTKGISDLSLSFSDVKKFDILSSDTQDSFDNGLLVLVIGCMTLKNDKIRKFCQSFFLAPQEGGYFVLNDVFRLLDDEETVKIHADETFDPLRSTNHEPVPNHELAILVNSLESKQEADDNNNPTKVSPQVVASAFLERYYHILTKSPELVHRFYKDSSRVSWQGRDGVTSNVTTTKGISNHFLSFVDAKKCDIRSYDVQDCFDNGLSITVIGCMTLQDDKTKKFNQSFFLAPQENGYFVSDDVFRFLDDEETVKIHTAGTSDPLQSTSQEPVTDQITMVSLLDSKKETSSSNPTIPVTETSRSAVENNTAFSLKNSFPNIKPVSTSAAENSDTSASQDSDPNTANALEETSIFAGNLGKKTEVEELTEAFERLGTIKPNRIQISKFESPTSVQSSVQSGTRKSVSKQGNERTDDAFHQQA